MKYYLMLLSVVMFVGFTSCNQTTKPSSTSTRVKSGFQNAGLVMDVIQTTGYTYCRVKVSGDEYWVAISKLPVKEGQILYFNPGLEMRNFHSQELNRNFKLIYLVKDASIQPNQPLNVVQQSDQAAPKPSIVKNAVKIKLAKDGITVAKLYANKANFAGKKVRIRGKITKYNPQILGKNFVHIQDGSEYGGNFDLTVTTQDQLTVGDVVTFEGKIILNKDFGSGYFYPVIMEEAVVVK